MSTPWGFSQQQKAYCGGNIIFHSTASHGGFKVQDDWNKKIPVYMRNSNGWYEEDCDWAKVAVVFMKDDKILYEDAAKTLKNWFPGEYMQYFKCKLEISDSLKLREIDFINRTKNDYVVTAALSWADNMVKVHAVKGGRLENGQYASRDEKWFLVPKTEYTMNFIIDQARHQETEPGF
uniref:DUF7007 domain-containing protein n=1 Tax=viral metagenome TaxID=1070528 RepID=A0A6M3IMF7_9ZZZZ